MSSTNRGSKPGRDKAGKTNHIPNGKTETALAGGKNQPTAEQLRIAQLTSSDVDPDLTKKILQVSELTGRTKDEALTALHDCDYDANRAVEALLEKQDDQAEEWQEIGKKKKAPVTIKGSQGGGSGETNTTDSGTGRTIEVIMPVEQDRMEQRERGGESIPRGRRDRAGPPRLQRGRGYGSVNGDKGGSTSRERPQFEQGRGGGYPRRRGNSNAVGGGRSYSGRGFSTGRNNESGPQIDTWTNEKTVNGNETSATPDWGEDWANDEWSGSLDESRVFTASTSTANSSTAYDATVSSAGSTAAVVTSSSAAAPAASSFFDPSTLGGSQVYVASSTVPTVAAASSRTTGMVPSADGVTTMMSDDAAAGGVYRSAGLQPGSIGGHESLASGLLDQYGISRDLYLSRYTKEATEMIKNAVGIGNSAMGGHPALGIDQLNLPTSQSAMQGCSATKQQQLQRPRVPPPSKIPASAVEMPASMNSAQLDVQFGNWDPPAAIASSANSSDATTLSFTADVNIPPTHYAAPPAHSMAQPGSVLQHNVSNMPGGYEMPSSVSRSSMISTSVSDSSKASLLALDDIVGSGTGSASKSSPVSGYQGGSTSVTKDFVNSKLQLSTGPASSVSFPSSQPDVKPNAYQSKTQQPPVTTQATAHPSLPFSQVGSYAASSEAAAPSVYKSATTSAGLVPAFSAQPMNQYSSSFGGYVNTDGSAAAAAVQFASYSGTAAPGFGPQTQMVGGGGTYGTTPPGQGTYQGTTHKAYGSSGSLAAATEKQHQPSTASAYQTTGLNQPYDVANSYQLGSGVGTGQLAAGGSSGYQMSQTATPYHPGGQMSYQGVSYQSVAPGYESVVGGQVAGAASYGGSTGHSSYNTQNLYAQQQQRQGRDATVPTAGSGYPSATDVPTGTAGYQQRVSQAYGTTQQQQTSAQMPVSVAAGKLTEGLGKLSVKDTAQSGGVGQYDTGSSAALGAGSNSTQQPPVSLSTATTTTSSAGVGLLPATATTSAAARTTSSTVTTTKSSVPATSKAMVNMPVGGPGTVMNNYMIAQPPGFQLAAFGYPATQQPVTYTYDDLHLMQQQQQRFSVPYYDMPFQPATTMTGRDASASLTAQNYAAGTDATKLAPIDPMSPVALQPAAQQQVTVAAAPGAAAAAAQQQQSYLNPAAMHPAPPAGYSYYYPGTGIMPVGSYYAPMIPMGGMALPLANPAHGVTTATTQYQKAAIYGSHAGYGVGGQTQDFSKSFGASQTGGKGPVAAGTGGTASDVLTGGPAFSKSHVQTYDKSGFHSGTPPPAFNMGMPSAAQTGAAAALGGGYGGPYMPMMQHQSHSTQMLHHPMSQDASLAGRGSAPQSVGQQPKAGSSVNKQAGGAYSAAYWGTN